MKIENKTWYYYGNGMDDFGMHNLPQDNVLPQIQADEVLARVDAVAICASDIKMIHMGNEYPLFKDRDFLKEPAILGHELSLTVVSVGKNLSSHIKEGMRIGVQPDVYMDQVRYCIGVNVQGGFQKYMILGKSVFYSDNGMTVFPIEKDISHASIAQLEPNACVEAAYRPFSRKYFQSDKKLFIYIDENVSSEFLFDMDLHHKETFAYGPVEVLKDSIMQFDKVLDLNEFKKLNGDIDDLLVVGNPEKNTMEELIQMLSIDSVFCWMQETPQAMNVPCDIAKIHYSRINFVGCTSHKMTDAFDEIKNRIDLLPHGHLLIMGGAGAMGRIHTLRAILHPEGPDTIVVSARGKDRLLTSVEDFQDLATKYHKKLYAVATNESDWKEQLVKIAPEGFDDVVVCAPGIDPVEKAVPFLRADGMLILFSGTKYGAITQLAISQHIMEE
ncbi:MAG: alcohol dehydrogenase catalytic domain-containing protein [Longicatena sp.]